MDYVYTFVDGTPDFVWLPKTAFRKTFGVNQAIAYLRRIRGTLKHEAQDARKPSCFYTGIRNTFAELDGLGKLHVGEYGQPNSARNAITFGEQYLGRINRDYRKLFGLVYDLYRHGLAHGHLIRIAKYKDGKSWIYVGWTMTADTANHLALRKQGRHIWLTLSVPQLVQDTLSAIDLVIKDLEAGGPASERLLKRFKRGYEGGCIVLAEPPEETPPRPKKGKKQPPRLNWYSRDSINRIRAKYANRGSKS